MPILANASLPMLELDIDRYEHILNTQTCMYRGGAYHEDTYYKFVEISDTEINGLEDCRVLLAYADSTNGGIVYSCYFRQAKTSKFGQRVVQVEVRCTVPGLAREIMREYFMRHYDTLRTDISNTPSGRRMWEKFVLDAGQHYYLADVSIDLRKPYGASNQDANQPEIYQNLRPYNADEMIWHDNRQDAVVVVYATNEKLL